MTDLLLEFKLEVSLSTVHHVKAHDSSTMMWVGFVLWGPSSYHQGTFFSDLWFHTLSISSRPFQMTGKVESHQSANSVLGSTTGIGDMYLKNILQAELASDFL